MDVQNNYIVRRPALELDILKSIYQNGDCMEILLEAALKNSDVMERILIASNSLYQQLVSGQLSSGAKLSLIKYLIRMSSRTMPFGLFSGLSMRNFTEPMHNSMLGEEKKVRISINWYKRLISRVEKSQNIHSELKVSINPSVIINDQYLSIENIINNTYQHMKIKNGSLIKSLLYHSETPIKIVDLLHKIVPHSNEKKILCLGTIQKLLKSGFLISELQPSVSYLEGDSLLEKLLNSRHFIEEELYTSLCTIASLIKDYCKQPVGDGISTYLDIIHKMQAITESNQYLVIDLIMQSADRQDELEQEEASALVGNVSFLADLSQQFSFNIWDSYYLQFINKYGYYNEVSLNEVLDKDKGIGLPTFIGQEQYAELDEKYMNIVLGKILAGQRKGQDTIELSDEDVHKITDIYADKLKHKLNDGYDMKFSSFIEDNKKMFHLGVNSFGNTGSSFTGRFDLKNDMNPYYYDDYYLTCEINGIPNNYPDLGITYQKPNYVININSVNEHYESERTIQIGDIYVGADTNGLYLKSKSLNKKLLPVSTHMLYYNNFVEQKTLLFLSLFGKYMSKVPKNMGLGRYRFLNFIPRIQYKNVIISPKRWNISVEDLEVDPIGNLHRLSDEFSLNNQYVYLLDGDKTMPIIVTSPIGQQLIIDYIKKAKRSGAYITLIEAPELNANVRCNQPYIVDYVVTVLPSRSGIELENLSMGEDVATHVREIRKDWAYYKISYNQNQKDKVLTLCLHFLYKQGLSEVFFINYSDVESGDHLRIRYKIQSSSIKNELSTLLTELLESELIHDYSAHIFEPEINRYGGQQLYDIAYQYFCSETKVYCQTALEQTIGIVDKKEQGIIFILFSVFDFFDSYENAFIFLEQLHDSVKKDHVILQQFKSNRNYYVGIGERAIAFYKEYQNSIFKDKKEMGREYSKLVTARYSKERSNYIFNSMVHMTLNRVTGINRSLENEIYCLAKYILYNLKYSLEIKGEYYEFL
ncbi:thiopeptide-type bacteriocin biosynthesis protein [Sutcliffiella rhizosphaerae]|uniref:Nisin biosynthesis protein NisB n=1 Tax=Sutcliffiella rhizosphaerae TaxID=2880967 RepID=A0ABM8YMQ2_9BACI|nr:thiopeptide-type bacteriocin biosynthesis protein [Sutcliffiella rhizosphaerae]CAG9621199.1 Nisin biosynthesis protein NisB [Sutcliffiella rhizosphaerae]